MNLAFWSPVASPPVSKGPPRKSMPEIWEALESGNMAIPAWDLVRMILDLHQRLKALENKSS